MSYNNEYNKTLNHNTIKYNKTLTILKINVIFFTQIYAFCETHPVKFQNFDLNGF